MASKRTSRKRGPGTRPRPAPGSDSRPPGKTGYRDDEPPKGPWGSFPLTELTILAGLILLVFGLVTSNVLWLTVGLLLGSAGGLELSIREHFAGYRSHTTMLAGVFFALVSGVAYFAAGLVLWQALGLGVLAFGTAFWLFRRAFEKVSGGLSYRVR
jgi:hypothetical protein